MSDRGTDDGSVLPEECARLESALQRLLEDYDGWRRRARAGEERAEELEAAVRELSSGELDPLELSAALEASKRERAELVRRLEEAEVRVRRLVARLDFLQGESA